MLTKPHLILVAGLLAALAAGPAAVAEEATGAPGTAASPVASTAVAAAAPDIAEPDAAALDAAPGDADGPYAAAVADSTGDDAWCRWLAALEGAVMARQATGQPESGLLYPLDSALGAGNPAQPYRHLAIAKAVTQLETGAERRAGRKGRREEPPAGADASPLLALANARNYLNLSEYDKALEWYGQAAARDADGNFRRETGRESLAAAICARDSAAAGRAVAALLALDDPAGREDEIVLGFRWLLNRQDSESLGWLLRVTDTPAATADERVAFWRAYALSWLERRPECLGQLRGLLALGGDGRRLRERERGWVLTATADLLLLEGARAEAEALYLRLAECAVPALRQWGRLQSAGLAFVGHRYGEAGAGYREICQADRQGTWGAHACAMADIAAQLDRLLSEGERYGADAHYRP